jgi:hypothetical protein
MPKLAVGVDDLFLRLETFTTAGAKHGHVVYAEIDKIG